MVNIAFQDKAAVEAAVEATRGTLATSFDTSGPDRSTTFNSTFYDGFMHRFDSFNAARDGAQSLAADDQVSITNPIYGHQSLILRKTLDGQAVVDNAKAASDALDQMPLEERIKILKLFKEKLEKYNDAIRMAITADTGKPFDVAQKEMGKGKAWIDYVSQYAEEELEPTVTRGGIESKRKFSSLGGAQIIGASNYPFALAIDGIAAAFAAGNGVVISATDKAPNWAFPVMQAAQEAVDDYVKTLDGDPRRRIGGEKEWIEAFTTQQDNMFQLAIGRNDQLSHEIPMLQFVGSTEQGTRIIGERAGKPTIAEMGGNNVTVVMNSGLQVDGMNVDRIAKETITGMEPVGARCTAPRLLCVQSGEASAVADKVIEYADDPSLFIASDEKLIGNPFQHKVRNGPMMDKLAYKDIEDVMDLVNRVFPGQNRIHGGFPTGMENTDPQSLWMRPVAIDLRGALGALEDGPDKTALEDAVKREIFGPLVFITEEVQDLGQAVAVTQQYDEFKLAGSIYASDEEGRQYAKETGVTAIHINGPSTDLSPYGFHGNGAKSGTVGGPGYIASFAKSDPDIEQSIKISATTR